MHKSLFIVLFFALSGMSRALAADSTDLPPTGGRISSPTRFVIALHAREQALMDAVSKHDDKALTTLVAPDFAQYSLSRGMLITPRADWLRLLSARPLKGMELNNMSAIDHGSTLVANFEMRVATGSADTRRFAVVDVWSKNDAAAGWILAQRYIASLDADADVPGENLQSGVDPNKRI